MALTFDEVDHADVQSDLQQQQTHPTMHNYAGQDDPDEEDNLITADPDNGSLWIGDELLTESPRLAEQIRAVIGTFTASRHQNAVRTNNNSYSAPTGRSGPKGGGKVSGTGS